MKLFQTVVLSTVKPSIETIQAISALLKHDTEARPSVHGVYTSSEPVEFDNLRFDTLAEKYGA